jgi:endoglucanase Acf2
MMKMYRPLLALATILCAISCIAEPVRLGTSTYFLAPKGADPVAPPAPWRTDEMKRQAVPTNQWYSSLVFGGQREPIHAQPLSVVPIEGGLEVALPRKQVVPTERRDVEIQYPHREPVTVTAASFKAGRVHLAKVSDWAIDMAWSEGTQQLRATVAHGGPYVQFKVSTGDLRLRLPSGLVASPAKEDGRILEITGPSAAWAAYGPTGVRWEAQGSGEWLARLPAGRGYLSLAALPDRTEPTRALLARHAYTFIDDTRVTWAVDRAKAEVTTRFAMRTSTLEGSDVGPLMALYPHHWHRNGSVEGRLGPAYDTVRGPLKLLSAHEFQTVVRYPGFVPTWPAVSDPMHVRQLQELTRTDVRNARRMMLEIGNGPYWQGKGLQRIAKLLDVVEAQGDASSASQLIKLMQGRVESWFSGDSRKTYFHLDRSIGSLLSHPEEYFSIEQMNDHHFHYGYWIRTVAELALRDPAWAARDRWGGLVDLLVADIATTKRGSADFPFLRNFDPYEGHSWASGTAMGGWGNNQESSSEAVNAWAGLILWGEIQGDTALRDLGIWLYTSEIQAIRAYWFDPERLVFPPEYPHVETSMVFGGKYAHNTWWTDEPRQIKGINLLPITTASTYLGSDPNYVKRNLGTLEADTKVFAARGKRADPPDIWQDLFAKYLALADPAAAAAQWSRWGAVELGDTRSHTWHWIASLVEMGVPDLSVTADTTFFAVFKRTDGQRTYLSYLTGPESRTVTFSDGHTMLVQPRVLAKSTRSAALN